MSDLSDTVLRQKLESLPRDKQILFSLIVCERMKPALNQFSKETGFDGLLYENCLDIIWRHLQRNISASASLELAQNCFNSAPDTELFSHPLTSAALNAALSVAATLSFVVDYNIDHLIEVASLARDTAASYAQIIDSTRPLSLNFQEVTRHPIVQRESLRQLEDIKFIESLPARISNESIYIARDYAARPPPMLPTKIY